ncbi:MAG TPA: hypothetical protein VJ579_01440 [Candidatus Paceibacterota bacterium]|nr:hypothetical protein [Candidatus Paceibacterota bacterium]
MDISSHWQTFDLKIAVTVFVAYMIVDAMYAYYTIAVTNKRPFASASVGALMHFLIAFGVLNYVQNYLYIVPLAIGSWIGTYLVVRHDLKNK